MKIIMSDKPVETNSFKPFTSKYDKIYVSYDEDMLVEQQDFQLTEKNIKKISDIFNFSWDGEIYWFKNEYDVLNHLDDWFAKEENHSELDDDSSFRNCFLIKQTPNGLCIIDTQRDVSSTIHSFLTYLKDKVPDISYTSYDDCHLIDNIKLGRGSVHDEFEILYLLYKENVIDHSFFLRGISSFTVDDDDNEYNQLFPNDKTIVITGKMDVEREFILANLNNAGYQTSEKVTDNSWLWYGDKVGANKIQAAKDKNVTCTPIADIIEGAYQKYLFNKNNAQKKMKP